AAEEIHDTAAPHHRQGLLPGSWIARRFDHGIRSKPVFGKRFYGSRDIVRLRDVEGRYRAQALGNLERGCAPRQGDDANAAARKHADKLQPDGATANHRSAVAGPHFHLMATATHA